MSSSQKVFGLGKDIPGIYIKEVSATVTKGMVKNRFLNGYNGASFRWYQKNLISAILEILLKQDKAALVSPTATGKTPMMVALAELHAHGKNVVILTGRNQLQTQTQDEIHDDKEENGALKLFFGISENKHINVINWQKANNLAKSIEAGKKLSKNDNNIARLLTNIALMMFDEVHLGGSSDAQSFQRILKVFSPKKTVFVTATPWQVNKKLFKLETDAAIFHITDAMLPGPNGEPPPLNTVEIIRLNSSLELDLVKFTDVFGEYDRYITDKNGNKEDVWERMLNDALAGNKEIPIVKEWDYTARALSRKLRKNGVVILESVRKKLRANRRATAFYYYFKDHSHEKALFFVSSINEANEAKKQFDEQAIIFGKNVECAVYHSADDFNEDGEIETKSQPLIIRKRNEENLDNFMDKNGKTNLNVLFCVGMLNEGFNYKPLRLVFDCIFNAKNVPRMIQRMGRILRILEDENGINIKPVSLYYYVEDVNTYLPKGISLDPESTKLIYNGPQLYLTAMDSSNKSAKEKREEIEASDDINSAKRTGALVTMAASGDNEDDVCLTMNGTAERTVDDISHAPVINTISNKFSRVKMPLWVIKDVQNNDSKEHAVTYADFIRKDDDKVKMEGYSRIAEYCRKIIESKSV